MELANKILKHPQYLRYIELNSKAETNRVFCKHDLQHALDVARVACIISMEKKLEISKEVLYAAALLHDIAKWKQYRYGVDHAAEGAVLAREILEDIGVNCVSVEEITEAIKTHRGQEMEKSLLGAVLYESDKVCRPCMFCKSIDKCNRFLNGEKPEFKY